MPDLSKISIYNRIGAAENKQVKVIALTAVTHTILGALADDVKVSSAISAGALTFPGSVNSAVILGGLISTTAAFQKAGPAAMDNAVLLTGIAVGGVDILAGATHSIEAVNDSAFSVMREITKGAVTVTITTNGGDDLNDAISGVVAISLIVAVPAS
jgi:hypothetical protein